MKKHIMKIKTITQKFIQDKSGLTAVEYAISGGLIIGSMIFAFNILGISATKNIDCLANALGGDTTLSRNEHAGPTPVRNPHCFN
jgi:pilus assembly protein Flp/PilA